MKTSSLVVILSLALVSCSQSFAPSCGRTTPARNTNAHSTPSSKTVSLQTSRIRLKYSSKNNDNSSSSSNPSRIILDAASALLPAPVSKRVESFTGDFQGFLDRVTDGWALSFADLSPESPTTVLGQSFLLTNAAYLIAGLTLTFAYNDLWLAFWTDCAAICSYNYHYTQLQCGSASAEERDAASQEVRLALLLDYSAAGVSIVSALYYLISATFASHTLSPEEGQAILASTAGIGCLLLSWKWEYGRPYMFWHGLWHLGSASAGYLIGVSHQHVMSSL